MEEIQIDFIDDETVQVSKSVTSTEIKTFTKKEVQEKIANYQQQKAHLDTLIAEHEEILSHFD